LNLHKEGKPYNATDVHIFNYLEAGIEGPINLFHEVVLTSGVDVELYNYSGLDKILPNDNRTKSQYLINRRADFSFMTGEIEPMASQKEISETEKEIDDLQEKLELAEGDSEKNAGSRRDLIAQRVQIRKQKAELEKKIDKITGKGEAEL